MQNETRMNQQFQRKQVDPSKSFVDTSSDKLKYGMSIFASDDQSVIEFQLYIQHLKEEASKLDRDMAKFAQLTEDLKSMTARTGWVLRIFAILNSLQNLVSRFGVRSRISICKRAIVDENKNAESPMKK